MATATLPRDPIKYSTRHFDLDKFNADFQEYIETVVKNETPEESKAILIRTGVIDEDGNFITRHKGGWG